jgi:hypothetical protein
MMGSGPSSAATKAPSTAPHCAPDRASDISRVICEAVREAVNPGTTIACRTARRSSRQRHCYVYENIGPGYHLLLVDDDGGLVLAEQVIDFETAEWLACLVNEALAALRGTQP